MEWGRGHKRTVPSHNLFGTLTYPNSPSSFQVQHVQRTTPTPFHALEVGSVSLPLHRMRFYFGRVGTCSCLLCEASACKRTSHAQEFPKTGRIMKDSRTLWGHQGMMGLLSGSSGKFPRASILVQAERMPCHG